MAVEALLAALVLTHPAETIVALEDSDKPTDVIAVAEAYAAWPGHCAQARGHLERLEDLCPNCSDLRGRVTSVKSSCMGHVQVSGVTGSLHIDGERKGVSPAKVRLWPGPHIARVGGLERAFCVEPKAMARISVVTGDPRNVTTSRRGARPRAAINEAAAIRHLEAGEHCAAALRLEAVYAAVSDPKVLFNLALVLERQPARCAQAIDTYGRYLADCNPCTKRDTAKQRQLELQKTCAASVELSATEGASLYVGDTSRGESTARISLPPGRHRVRATLDGRSAERTLLVAAGDQRQLKLEVPSGAPGSTPRPGEAASAPAAEVPPPTPAAEAPPPTPVAEAPPPAPVAEAPIVSVTPEPASSSGSSSVWTYTSLGLAGVSAAVGTVFILRAKSSHDELLTLTDGAATATEPVRPRAEALIGDLERDQTLAWVSWGVGAAAAVTSALLWWFDDPAPDTVVAPGPGGLTVLRRF